MLYTHTHQHTTFKNSSPFFSVHKNSWNIFHLYEEINMNSSRLCSARCKKFHPSEASHWESSRHRNQMFEGTRMLPIFVSRHGVSCLVKGKLQERNLKFLFCIKFQQKILNKKKHTHTHTYIYIYIYSLLGAGNATNRKSLYLHSCKAQWVWK